MASTEEVIFHLAYNRKAGPISIMGPIRFHGGRATDRQTKQKGCSDILTDNDRQLTTSLPTTQAQIQDLEQRHGHGSRAGATAAAAAPPAASKANRTTKSEKLR